MESDKEKESIHMELVRLLTVMKVFYRKLGAFHKNLKHGIGKMLYSGKGEYFGMIIRKVTFWMEKETAKECLLILTKIYIQETGKTVKNMDMELMFISIHKAE
jgi:hypothetical protein